MTLPPLPYAADPEPPARPFPYGGGKRIGSRDRVSRPLKEAILLAGEKVGSDGEGADGLAGYLEMVARTDIRAFCQLLGKVLPMTIAGTADGGGLVVEIVKRTYGAQDANG